MWRTTIKGLVAHKLRFLLTGLAVLLGVAFMAGTLVLTDTVGKAFDDLFADVNEGVDAVVREEAPFEDDFGQPVRPRIPEELLPQVEAVEGVAAADGGVGGFAQLIDREGEQIGDPGQGPPTLGFSWPGIEEINPLRVVEGEAPVGPDEAAIERAFAEGVSAQPIADVAIDQATAEDNDFEVGDPIEITTEAGTFEYTISAIVTFGEAESPGGASIAAWDLPTAQLAMGAAGEFDDIRAVADEGVSDEELVGNIEQSIAVGEIDAPESVEVLTGDELTEEDQETIADQLSFFNTFLLVFAFVALFVGVFIIFNTFSIVVAQRTREMALLRAVGASQRQVLASVVFEAVLVGLLASGAGLVAGIFLASVLQVALEGLGIDLPSTGTVVTGQSVALALVTGILITVVAAVVPARKASRVPPIAALRDVATERGTRVAQRAISGVAVAVVGGVLLYLGLFGEIDFKIPMGLFEVPVNSASLIGAGAVVIFLGVTILGPLFTGPLSRLVGSPLPRLKGTTGTLARNNASRSPKRTAATAAALMIGVGIIGVITIMANSAKASIADVIDKAYLADFVVDSGTFGFGGLSPDVADRIRELDGVEAVSGIRSGTFEVEGDTAQVGAVNPDEINQLFDVGVSEGQIEGAGPDAIFVLRDKAEEEGWEVGDTIPVRFARTGEQELTIAALYDEEQPAGTYTITTAGYEQNFEDVFDSQVYVRFAENTDLDTARAELEALVDEQAPNGEVQDQEELEASITEQIDQLLALIYVLLALAVIIALIGIANSLALSIYERTRELGLLRAVGMTRRQVRSAVRWESVIISVLGTLTGLAVSLFFSWAIFQAIKESGFEVLSIPIGQLVFIVVVAGLAGVVAAIGPARRASKLDVLESIVTE